MNELFGATTAIGPKKLNEDFYYAHFDTSYRVGFAIIADGMGGYQAGDRASKLAVHYLKKWWNDEIANKKGSLLSVKKISKQLDDVLVLINEELLRIKRQEQLNLGTTCSILFLLKDQYIIKHIGDSRIYLVKNYNISDQIRYIVPRAKNVRIDLLTEDHSWVQTQINKGLLTENEALLHPKRHILLHCLGIENGVEIFTAEGSYEATDLFILASDGFYSVYSNEQLVELLLSQTPNAIQPFCDSLVRHALATNKVSDNLTVIVVADIWISLKNKLSTFFKSLK